MKLLSGRWCGNVLGSMFVSRCVNLAVQVDGSPGSKTWEINGLQRHRGTPRRNFWSFWSPRGAPSYLRRTLTFRSINWMARNLVGGLEHFSFSHILGIIIPIDSYFLEGWPNHQPVGTKWWWNLRSPSKIGHVEQVRAYETGNDIRQAGESSQKSPKNGWNVAMGQSMFWQNSCVRTE